MLTFYFAPGSSSMAPHIALREIGVAFESRPLSFARKENRAARQGVDHARAVFGVADRRLGDREWALGRYSIADIHLFRLYWRNRHALPLAPGEFPNLSGHYDRMMARSAVRRTCEIEAAIGYEPPAVSIPH